MILLHSGKLLEYPNNPFAEEALILRAEVQFNQQNMAEALASYKMLKEKATNVERRQLAETGILRCAFLLRDDIETIHAATDLLAEAKLSPELRNEALYYRAKAYTKQKADKKAMEDYRELVKTHVTLTVPKLNIRLHNPSTTQKNMPLQRKSCSTI